MWISDWILPLHFVDHLTALRSLKEKEKLSFGLGRGQSALPFSCRQDFVCWAHCRAVNRAGPTSCFQLLSHQSLITISPSAAKPWSCNILVLLTLPASQMASFQPIITIVICLKCKFVLIMLQPKIVQCLPLPAATQGKALHWHQHLSLPLSSQLIPDLVPELRF